METLIKFGYFFMFFLSHGERFSLIFLASHIVN